MDKRKTYLVVGLGLLGGKYALELSRAGYRVLGINRSQSNLDWALEQGYVAEGKTRDFADLIGQAIVQERMDALTKDKPFTTLQDVVDVLNEFPEVRGALQDPAIRVGEPGSYAGKVCVLFAGVTGGGAQVYNTFFDYGVGTLIVMHMPEDDIKAVAEHNKGNVIIAGHMASDSIGFNRVLDAWQAEGLEVTRIGGLVSSAGC